MPERTVPRDTAVREADSLTALFTLKKRCQKGPVARRHRIMPEGTVTADIHRKRALIERIAKIVWFI